MKYRYKINGLSPLLMHADDVECADRLQAWRKDPKNKGISKSGDDRSPAWTWHTYVYGDGEHVVIPTENLSAALRAAGGMMTLKGTKSFKEASQCGILFEEDFLPVITAIGNPIKVGAISSLAELSFDEQREAVRAMGFELFVKRAKINSAKHIRVRPKFDSWSVSGTLEVTAKEIAEGDLKQLFELAGFYKGLGDWRPGCKTPGRFGRFETALERI